MGKDPAFLFYPDDYSKDTQCLSENVLTNENIMVYYLKGVSNERNN